MLDHRARDVAHRNAARRHATLLAAVRMTVERELALAAIDRLAEEIRPEEREQLEVVWLFRPKLFPEAEVKNLGRFFQEILAGACKSPESTVASLARELL